VRIANCLRGLQFTQIGAEFEFVDFAPLRQQQAHCRRRMPACSRVPPRSSAPSNKPSATRESRRACDEYNGGCYADKILRTAGCCGTGQPICNGADSIAFLDMFLCVQAAVPHLGSRQVDRIAACNEPRAWHQGKHCSEVFRQLPAADHAPSERLQHRKRPLAGICTCIAACLELEQSIIVMGSAASGQKPITAATRCRW
jgi:hypothetical protein